MHGRWWQGRRSQWCAAAGSRCVLGLQRWHAKRGAYNPGVGTGAPPNLCTSLSPTFNNKKPPYDHICGQAELWLSPVVVSFRISPAAFQDATSHACLQSWLQPRWVSRLSLVEAAGEMEQKKPAWWGFPPNAAFFLFPPDASLAAASNDNREDCTGQGWACRQALEAAACILSPLPPPHQQNPRKWSCSNWRRGLLLCLGPMAVIDGRSVAHCDPFARYLADKIDHISSALNSRSKAYRTKRLEC